jgi:hypothetical protein
MSTLQRSEWWFLMTYATLEECQPLFDNCKHFAYCHHDKDTREDGELKEPHTHILVCFNGSKSLEQIRTLINSQQNTFGENQRKVGQKWQPLNKTACFRYLLHSDDTEKYQYDEECRVTDSDEFWSKYAEYKNPFGTSCDDTFYQDLLAPYRSTWDFMDTMSRKYGRDFIKNYRTFEQYREDMRIADLEQQEIDMLNEQKTNTHIRKYLELCERYDLDILQVERIVDDWVKVNKKYEYIYYQEYLERLKHETRPY